MILRAYMLNPDGTTAEPLACGLCTTSGQMKQLPSAGNGGTKNAASVKRSGHPLFTQNLGQAMIPNANESAIAVARNVGNGQPGLARREFMENGGSTTRTYQISFTNGSGGDVTAVMGDAATIIYESLALTPLPGTVTVGGTWGANSLAIWKLVTGYSPVAIDRIRINFDATSYLTTASLIGYRTRPDAIVTTDNYNLATWVDPQQFQSLVVENPFKVRILWDALFGFTTLIPNGRTVTFTFYYSALADVHDMRLI